jgi:hypothetical protein
MPLPTVNDVQAVEPILTNMLLSYMQDDDRFVASRVFPAVPVDKDSGTYYTITKSYFFRDELEQRAAGGSFARIDWGLSTATYKTLQWAADVALADEIRANSQMPMDLEQVNLRLLAQRSLIRKEVQWAADFMTTSVWSNDDTTTTDWDDTASGDPVDDVLTASRTISNETGIDPNTMVLGYIVHQAIVNHPDVLDRLKYTQAATMSAIEGALAAIFGKANYWVAKGTYSDTNESATFSASAIIDDDCLVCQVDPGAGMFGATSGKTFVWEPGGGIGSVYSYRDESRHSDVVQHKEQWDQKVVATDLGYFFSGVV